VFNVSVIYRLNRPSHRQCRVWPIADVLIVADWWRVDLCVVSNSIGTVVNGHVTPHWSPLMETARGWAHRQCLHRRRCS